MMLIMTQLAFVVRAKWRRLSLRLVQWRALAGILSEPIALLTPMLRRQPHHAPPLNFQHCILPQLIAKPCLTAALGKSAATAPPPV
jgi:hypothetical protein